MFSRAPERAGTADPVQLPEWIAYDMWFMSQQHRCMASEMLPSAGLKVLLPGVAGEARVNFMSCFCPEQQGSVSLGT